MSMNWSDELRSLDRVGPSRDLWADVLARGAAPRARRVRLRRALVAVAAVVLVGAATAFAYRLLSPSPGFTAGLTGLESLPTVPWPADMPKGSLPMLARGTGLTPSEAEHRLRLVQSGLSFGPQSGLRLYAFPGQDGSACIFLVPGVGGFCLPTWNVNTTGHESIAWADWPGDGPPAPSGPLCIFGLVADNVGSVEADVGGVKRKIPIVDNSFYAGYDSISGTDSIGLVVHFEDGTTRTYHQPNPYAAYGPTGGVGPTGAPH